MLLIFFCIVSVGPPPSCRPPPSAPPPPPPPLPQHHHHHHYYLLQNIHRQKLFELVVFFQPSSSRCCNFLVAAVGGCASSNSVPNASAMAATNPSTSPLQSTQIVSASAAAAAPSSMTSAAVLASNIDRLLSEAIPASEDTTSFLESLAQSIKAVEAAHARPADPPLRSRPQDDVQSCMRGDAAALLLSSWFEQDTKQRVIRVFLSSTFTDTVHERAVLLRCVHPVVQSYAREFNFEVVFSEMRFFASRCPTTTRPLKCA